jgi:predicted nucleic acid-binding protein
MNVVDSSGWLEYFAGSPAAAHFADAIENTDKLIVPTLSVLEVFRRILQQRGEADALQAAALMQQGQVIDLTLGISLEAARLGHEKKLPLADSVILATARHYKALLWTQDADFKGIDGVKYFPKH